MLSNLDGEISDLLDSLHFVKQSPNMALILPGLLWYAIIGVNATFSNANRCAFVDSGKRVQFEASLHVTVVS